MKRRDLALLIFSMMWVSGCGSKNSPDPNLAFPSTLTITSTRLDVVTPSGIMYNTCVQAQLKYSFNNKVDRSSVAASVSKKENGDSTIVISTRTMIKYLTRYVASSGGSIKSSAGGLMYVTSAFTFITEVDPSDKFPQITDNQLLDLVLQQTFKYFWDFGHPVRGLTHERNTSGETVTSGGAGFGVMAIPVAVSRNFITRAQGLARMQNIFGFLKNTAQKFHGAFPHWLNGTNYFRLHLPLGSSNPGPLFFAHYSFLGVNLNGPNVIYANYQTQLVNHTKINYGDQDADILGKSQNFWHSYKLWHSPDGKKWSALIDHSDKYKDVPHEYLELASPVQTRYIKLENIKMPTGKFAISGLRVFGIGSGAKPNTVKTFMVLRTEKDKRSAWIRWRPVENAYANNIYYGTAPDKLYNCVMVHDLNEYWFKAMDLQKTYYFTIEAINENGVSSRFPVVKVD